MDAALELGIPCGGFVPQGRLAEDGRVPDRYPVEECGSAEYAARTELNVLRSDATLLLYRGELSGGTLLTLELCRRHGRPVEAVALDRLGPGKAEAAARAFLERERPAVLNVAGPRESSCPGLQAESAALLRRVFFA